MLEAEEYGISSKTVDEMLKSENPSIKRILGVTPGMGKALGVDEAWVVNIVKQVGNYGESFERNVGMGSPLKIDAASTSCGPRAASSTPRRSAKRRPARAGLSCRTEQEPPPARAAVSFGLLLASSGKVRLAQGQQKGGNDAQGYGSAAAGLAALFISTGAMAGKDLDTVKARGALIAASAGDAGFMLQDSQASGSASTSTSAGPSQPPSLAIPRRSNTCALLPAALHRPAIGRGRHPVQQHDHHPDTRHRPRPRFHGRDLL